MTRKPTKNSIQHDLRAARILLDEQSTKINGLNVVIGQHVSEVDRLFTRLRDQDREIARLNGYIDRVREVEGRSTYEVGTDGLINIDRDYDHG